MKIKNIIILIPIILGICLIGCTKNNVEEVKIQDTHFILDLEKALESRWNYVSKVENDEIKVESDSEYYKECVNKELSKLETYKEAEFKDARLRKLMLDYIEGLNTQLDSIKYYDIDMLKYNELWTQGYNLRSKVIVELVEDYGLKVDEKELNKIKVNVQVLKEDEGVEKEVEELSKTIKFQEVKNEYGYKTYSAIVENTTSVKFESFYLNIKLIDADGVVVETAISSVDNWNPSEKMTFEIFTDKDFEKIEWEYEYFNN